MTPSPPLLDHRRVHADGRKPERWMLVLHGIYGAGRNWGSVARRLVDERPEWGAVLVDLRQHGGSTGFAGPHTLDAAADDLRALVDAEGLSVGAILGHSFGGKVATIWARDAAASAEPGRLRSGAALSLWIVDSTPDARPPGGSAWEMLASLRAHPGPFPTREAAVEALVADGVARPVATWMSTNLEDDGSGAYRWRIDPDPMEALLRDFFETDTWSVLESPPSGLDIHVIKATGSSVLDEEACRRVEAAGEATDRVHLHRVEGGHWLNADNPDALLELVTREL